MKPFYQVEALFAKVGQLIAAERLSVF